MPIPAGADAGSIMVGRVSGYMPIILAMLGGVVLFLLRVWLGGDRSIGDEALMVLALAAYLVAGAFFLTDLYAPFRLAERLGLQVAAAGVALNLGSWLVRWVAAYDREIAIFREQGLTTAEMPWLFRYIPFANLYDLSLAFAFGAGVTTLIVIRRPEYRMVAAVALPLAAIILLLARFIGGEFVDLPPVLDSYWRPIHVGVAAISYGVALVCFAVAVLYLIKDGVRTEKMAFWNGLFMIGVYATVSRFGLFSFETFGTYAASIFVGTSNASIPLRADLPFVGSLMVAAAVFMIGGLGAWAAFVFKGGLRLQRAGLIMTAGSLVLQVGAIVMLIYQISNLANIAPHIAPEQYERFGAWMLQQQGATPRQIATVPATQLAVMADTWIRQNSGSLRLSLNANPVELAALVTAFAGTLFIVLIALRPERVRTTLPSAQVLDRLMYKLGGTAFAGLAVLLITGAVWANESWGRYWGWDAKETGALVAWLAYAGFLHSRVAYGWKGRRSAYFAIVAFLFIIFTYLGVSYLLPGLHSYA